MTKSLMQSNISRAIEQTFNIKHSDHKIDRVKCEGLEIDGHAIVSQDCNLLQEVAHRLGYGDRMLFNFVQHGRWSCINIDKVKVLWRLRLRQVSIGSVIYNMVYGRWTDGAFYADILSGPDVQVIIRPCGDNIEQRTILLPYHVYRIITDIRPHVPAVKYEHKALECVRPIDIKTISINRQGIYINRKFRDKIDIDDAPSVTNQDHVIINNYRLNIVYRGEVMVDVEMQK